MKIRVVTAKEIFRYLAKISLIFGIIAIFAKFFYTKKNVNNCFAFDSSKCLSTIKKEVLLLKEDDDININLKSNEYISSTFNSEFSMFKAVATTSLNNTNLENNMENVTNERK